MTIITSKSNPLIKKTKKLWQKKYRKTSYLIEGWHLLFEAQKSGANILRVFVTDRDKEQVSDVITSLTLVSDEVLKELSETQTPQGVVAEIQKDIFKLPETLSGRYLLLEDVQDPGNVGTMIRTADAAGFSGVILSEKSADVYNAKTLRSMQGSHFHLPIYQLDIFDVLENFKSQNVPILATTLSEQSVDYRKLSDYEKFVLVMGNEGSGISYQMHDLADELVHISMPGQAESLNVAVAAGIIIFSSL